MDLERLKIKMILHAPFFGALLHHLNHIESKRVPTAGCDGANILYNPDFMDKLSQDQQLFVMAHEIMHAAFLHIQRWKQYTGNNQSQMVHNIACDYLINDMLVNEQRMVAPPGALLDAKYKFADWTSDTLYAELMKNVKQIKMKASGGPGSGACSGDDLLQPEGDGGEPKHQSEAEAAAQEQKWKIAVNAAATIAKKVGNCPASMERLIDQLLKPKVDWKNELQNWFNQKVRDLSSWNNPNRRFVHQGIYLPSKKTEHIGHIVVAIDTSGSIGEHELNVFGSELNYIFETARPTKVTVIYCDCAINKTVDYTPDDLPLQLKPYGGGGTSFKPPFDWVKKNLKDDVAGLVYMTDMYGDFPSKAPEYPVLWMATSNIKAPFGVTVEYQMDK